MPRPFKLAVKAIILDPQERCLLLRRSAACRNFVGEWEWPGGKVDAGEEFAAAVVRETREETALDVEIMGLAGATDIAMASVHVVVLCMETRLLDGAVVLSAEHDQFAWVPLSQLGELPLTKHLRAFVLDYARKRTGVIGPAPG